jgi:hypothetical protein
MWAAVSSETLVPIYYSTRRNIQDYNKFCSNRCENLVISHKNIVLNTNDACLLYMFM